MLRPGPDHSINQTDKKLPSQNVHHCAWRGHHPGKHCQKADAFLRVIEQRENALLDFLKEPRTMDEIVNKWIIYKKPREPVKSFEFGERGMMKKHVDRLVASGVVVYNEGRYCKK
jgi:hypothetical protein